MRSEKREKKPAPSLRGNRSSNCFSEKSSKGGSEGKKQKRGRHASARRGERSRDRRSRGGSATKETVTGSGAAREEAVLPDSAPGHSWLAAALSAAKGHRPGTARGGEVAPGAEAAEQLGLRFPGLSPSPEAPTKPGKEGKDSGGSSSMSTYNRKPERARS
uniref:Uncharacterized protein n=1 Tax=Rhinopithecus bieti TaxID=61621 RepID=A0A2K6MLK9_RHIBE